MEDIIRYRFSGVKFSYYTSDEVRRTSVKEITNATAFDQLNRPLNSEQPV